MEQPPSSLKDSPSTEEARQPPITPNAFLPLQSPGIQYQNTSLLYDRHELRAPASHLGQALSPLWRLSPRSGGGSSLYDSDEFRAVAKQINGATHAVQNGLSLYSDLGWLDHLNMKSKSKKFKQITGLEQAKRTNFAGYEATNDQQHVPKIWKKLKRILLRWQSACSIKTCCRAEIYED